MKCNICGETYTSPSFGGPGVCPRCDCGIKPNGEKLNYEESLKIALNYKKGILPYGKGVFELQKPTLTLMDKDMRFKKKKKIKYCNKCKKISSFNQNQQWCINCHSEYAKKYGKKNRKRLTEIHRVWVSRNRGSKRYLETRRRKDRKWVTNNPEKVQAHAILHTALNKARIAKLACEVCGNFISEAHHHDYNKPLDVWWLCKGPHNLKAKTTLR